VVTVNQVLGVVRLQLLNVRFGIALPLAVLGAVLAFNLALFAANGWGAAQDGVSGVMPTLYLTIGVGYMQVATQTFRFVLGLGVTRRAFAAAVVVLAVLEAVGYGALLGVLRLVELGTGGWGIGLEFFELGQLGPDASPLLHWLAYAAPFVPLAALGALVGTVFARWATPGLWTAVTAAVLVLGAAAVLISLADGWTAVTGWLAAQSPLALTVGYPLVAAVLLGAAGWLVLRRATT
jgi:hypothetical protein